MARIYLLLLTTFLIYNGYSNMLWLSSLSWFYELLFIPSLFVYKTMTRYQQDKLIEIYYPTNKTIFIEISSYLTFMIINLMNDNINGIVLLGVFCFREGCRLTFRPAPRT